MKKHKSLNEIIEKKETSEVVEIEEEQEEEEEEEEVDHGPCVLCGIKDQNEMLCDGCDRPFHNSCVNISDEELEIMIEAEEDWFCEDCVKSGKNAGANDEMREHKLKKMDRADSDFNLDARDEVEFIKGTRGNPSEEKKPKQEKRRRHRDRLRGRGLARSTRRMRRRVRRKSSPRSPVRPSRWRPSTSRARNERP